MEGRLIADEDEYQRVLSELEGLLDAEPDAGTPEAERLRYLSVLAEEYELEHHPIDDSALTPQDAVRFALDQGRIDEHGLAEIMGGADALASFLDGQRRLTAEQIREFHGRLGIPAEILIR